MALAQKGSRWERECSKLLSLWLSEGERDDLVWRTSGSGSRHTTRQKQGRSTYNQAGDLCATDPSAQFFFDLILVECKRGYTKGPDSRIINILYGLDRPADTKPSLLWQWWDKAEKERRQAKRKQTIILFKRQAKRACILLEKRWMLQLSLYNGNFLHDAILLKFRKYPTLMVCDLKKWLNWCSPKTIPLIYCT